MARYKPVGDQLLKRLRADGIVPFGHRATIDRLHPNQRDRYAGAWMWSAAWQQGGTGYTAGSRSSMKACLEASLLVLDREPGGVIHVTPKNLTPGGPPPPPAKQPCPVCGRTTIIRADGRLRMHRLAPGSRTQCPGGQHTPGEAAGLSLERHELSVLIDRWTLLPDSVMDAVDRYVRHEQQERQR